MIKYLITAAIVCAGTTSFVVVRHGYHGDSNAGSNPGSLRSSDLFRGVGYVEPASEVRRLSFRSGGVIAQCKVSVGQRVQRDEVLMTLHNEDIAAALEAARREVELARAERDKALSGSHPKEVVSAEQKVAEEHARLELANSIFSRTRALASTGGVSRTECDTAEAELKRATASLLAAQADLEQIQTMVRPEDRVVAEAKVRWADARAAELACQYEYTLLRAPIEGEILEIVRREGESARTTDTEPAVIFGDLSHLRVRAEIDERYVSRVRVGQKVRIAGRGLGDAQYAGVVSQVRGIMGKKTVFARTAAERKDLDVVQVLIDVPSPFTAPVGLEVDVEVLLGERAR